MIVFKLTSSPDGRKPVGIFVKENHAICVILQAEYHATLFAYGEFYCYAVLFGLRRVIFASQV